MRLWQLIAIYFITALFFHFLNHLGATVVITDIYDDLVYDEVLVFEYCKDGPRIVHCQSLDSSAQPDSYSYDNSYIESEGYYDRNTRDYKSEPSLVIPYMLPYLWEEYDQH